MFDHIGLRVKDLEAARKLYAAMLAPLGHVLGPSGKEYAGFGPKDKPKLWLHLDKKGVPTTRPTTTAPSCSTAKATT
jgi:catechol 2,3-dioxygenase-like lactoylglutathione lyase family enzyme